MRRQTMGIFVAVCLALTGSPRSTAQQSAAGSASVPVFSHPQSVTHPYLPLVSLQQDVLEGKEGTKTLRVVRIARPDLRKSFKLAGHSVETLGVQSRAYADEKLTNVATEYFAQADDGTLHCLGRAVDEYVNRQVAGHEGSWMLADDARIPKLVLPTKPRLGEKLTIGDAGKPAPEADEVVSLTETVTAPAGSFANCLKIKTVLSDGKVGYRYYAQGVGCVKEAWDGGEVLLTSSATLEAFKAVAAAQKADPRAADPLARVALRSVGADPRANQYWMRAINNPGLTVHERKNLIEDLNEDGLSDPKHPTQRDLPLILSRIGLIESLAPFAMDQANADAFQEAYKDLVKMARTLTGQAPPR